VPPRDAISSTNYTFELVVLNSDHIIICNFYAAFLMMIDVEATTSGEKIPVESQTLISYQ
jgi:hypothetical protein